MRFLLAALFLLLASCTVSDNSVSESSDLQSCGNNSELFSVFPVEMDRIVTMTPVGMMTPPGHVFPAPHMYFFPLDFRNPKDVEVPVYSSANMVLKQIGLRHYNRIGEKEDYVDYTLVFSPCSEFDLYFHHLRNLTYPPFAAAAADILKTCTFSTERNEDYCSGEVSIPVAAGVSFATAGDLKAGIWGFDLGARDYRLEGGRNFVKPDRHCDSNNVFDRCYVVCPFDYFTEKSAVKFSNAGQQLGCGGNLYFDVAGTAQGYWFSEFGKPMSEEGSLYLGPDNLNPSTRVFSVGTSVPGLLPGLYRFSPGKSVNRDFAELTADGNAYCYETQEAQRGAASILVKMMSSSTLRIGAVADCSSSFGEYADFER